jgi:hypothetical protein
MAESKGIGSHVRAIREVLTRFAREQGDKPDEFVVRVWPSPWPGNVHALVSVTSFRDKTALDRQAMIWDYLREHLPAEHRVHLASLEALSSDEWDLVSDEPLLAQA